MGTTIRQQLYEIAAGLLAGVGVGIVYELFAPLYRCRSRALHYILDFVFSLFASAWIFYAGQVSGRGAGILFLFLCAVGWAFCRGLFRSPLLTHEIKKPGNKRRKFSDHAN